MVIGVYLVPPVYDTISYSRVYDLHTLVGKEFSVTTKPINIVSKYFPTAHINLLANCTYFIKTETNTLELIIGNIRYNFLLGDSKTKQIVLPILIQAIK